MSSEVLTREAIPESTIQHGAPGTHGTAGSRTLRYAVLIVFVLLVLIPLYVLVVTSLKKSSDISADTAWSLPHQLSVEGWSHAWDSLAPPLFRSLILAVSVAVIST